MNQSDPAKHASMLQAIYDAFTVKKDYPWLLEWDMWLIYADWLENYCDDEIELSRNNEEYKITFHEFAIIIRNCVHREKDIGRLGYALIQYGSSFKDKINRLKFKTESDFIELDLAANNIAAIQD